MMTLPTIYFGPMTSQPSWAWVGADIAAFMRTCVDVRYFEEVADIADGALVFWIKCPPNVATTEEVKKKSLSIVFFPVDAFLNQSAIAESSEFIDYARLICLHSHSLAPFFPSGKTEFVDHYNKYGVNPDRRRPDNRTLLWIGGFQYVPYVLAALDKISWPHDRIVLLTNQYHAPARIAADKNAHAVGIGQLASSIASYGVQISDWSEEAQRAALLTCAAAFDVKYTECFNQLHKPPTKLQKYLMSGIPCAINKDFPAAGQVNGVMDIRRIDISSPPTLVRRQDWAYRKLLARRLSIDVVAQHYLRFAQTALGLRSDKPMQFPCLVY